MPAVWSTHFASVHLSSHHLLSSSAAWLTVTLPQRAAPSLRKPQQNTLHSVIMCIYTSKAFVMGVLAQSIISPSRDACAQSTLSLARPSLSVPCPDAAASPSAEGAEIQITRCPVLSDPGLLHAQWRAAFGYKL